MLVMEKVASVVSNGNKGRRTARCSDRVFTRSIHTPHKAIVEHHKCHLCLSSPPCTQDARSPRSANFAS